jgi:pantetheine-phosphate adenylyltransferase
LKTALFAGSFDPPTLGHLSLITRGCKLFDKLYLCVASNENKKPLFSLDQRVACLKSITKKFPNVEVSSFTELTVDAAKKLGADVLIRGARNGCDFELEAAMAHANFKLGQIETLILPANPQTAHISSTIIKDILATKGSLKEFLPPEVLEILKLFKP